MFFWQKKPTPEQLAQDKRQEAAIAALTAGDIPDFAKHRIAQHAAREDKFFSSDLTANEFLLIRQLGIEPLSLVMGSAFFSVSLFGRGFTRPRTGDMKAVSDAQLQARRNALQRMEIEAKLLGATGVIAVRVVRNEHAFIDGQVEFTAIGTAVRIPGFKGTQVPFLSALSASEYWQLHNAGYAPKGLALGVSVYYAAMDNETRKAMFNFWGNNAVRNQEISLFTQSFYQARELAMNALTADGVEHGADGVVGVTVTESIRENRVEISNVEWIDLLIDFAVMGTTIEKVGVPEKKFSGSPLIMIDLASKSSTAINLDYVPPSAYGLSD